MVCKTELVNGYPWTSAGMAEAENETAKYAACFNEMRPQSSTGNLPPVEYERACQEAPKTATANPATP